MLAAMVARLMRWFVLRGVVVAEADRAWVEDGLDRANDGDMAAADGPSAFEPQVKTCSPSCSSSLQPPRSRSLRQTRGGSVPRASTIRTLRPTQARRKASPRHLLAFATSHPYAYPGLRLISSRQAREPSRTGQGRQNHKPLRKNYFIQPNQFWRGSVEKRQKGFRDRFSAFRRSPRFGRLRKFL
jgi:hypothetical protein